MINVKISLPGENFNSSFEKFIDPKNKIFQDIKFHINNDVPEADFWFVFEDLYKNKEKCLVNKKNIVYLNTETSYGSSYFLSDHMQKYLNQFHLMYGCYETFRNNYTNTLPFLPWMINYKSNSTIFSQTGKGVGELRELNYFEKTKKISVICSNKQMTDNHKIRYEFTKKLKEYFGAELDWYGSGENPIENKWKGIKDYKYHIVIENGQKNNLISEKLYDSYLGLAFPIYFGAPNSGEYFPKNSLSTIDINNFKESIKTIESIINKNTYENNVENLLKSRNLVLGEYNFLNRMSNIIEYLGYEKKESSKENIVLNSVNNLWKKNTSIKRKVKLQLSRKLRLAN